MLTHFQPVIDNYVQWLFATPNAIKVFKNLIDQLSIGIKNYRPQRPLIPEVLADDELRSIAVPTLLLVGEKEVVYDPSNAVERAVRLIPGIEVEFIPGAGHAAPLDQPDAVNGSTLRFLC